MTGPLLETKLVASIDEMRKPRRARYEFACRNITGSWNDVIDIGCGPGAGSFMMAHSRAIRKVLAVDREVQIMHAEQHFMHESVKFMCVDLETWGAEFLHFEWGVCFEVLEHLEDPAGLLDRLRSQIDQLIVSVPNEMANPFKAKKMPHHKRHYTPSQLEILMGRNGWTIDARWGMRDGEFTEGWDDPRTLVAVCS